MVWGERDHRFIFIAKIPENVLQEEPELLMWYDQALARTKGDQPSTISGRERVGDREPQRLRSGVCLHDRTLQPFGKEVR